jgi:N-methylhydantoinase A
VEAVAICFLHSFRNNGHERKTAEILQEYSPHLFISLSSEVAPEIREYERASTTAANAYLQPVMSRYLSQMTHELSIKGFQGKLFVMLSSGGITTAETAARFPVRVVESGPAAGAMAAAFFGSLVGEQQLLSLDMGGTTAKICLVNKGKPVLAADTEVARVYRFKKGTGIPLKVPCVELVEIGAGGGSIAHIDKYGLLKVGPQSAESNPGPACYDQGGVEPTVTDADLLLGYLDPSYFLGGKMHLSLEKARGALYDKLASPLGMTLESAASGIYQVVNSSMASATQVYAAEKGVDLRCYPLLAFGGAGPVHACAVAERLGITRIIIPPRAGLTSAFGLLVTPPAFDFAQSYMGDLGELDWNVVETNYRKMETEGRALLKSMGLEEDEMEVTRTADMRYAGQSYEITIALPDGDLGETGYQARVKEAFNREYERLYHQANRDFAIEALMWRASVRGPEPQLHMAAFNSRHLDSTRNPVKEKRRAFFPDKGGFLECAVFNRYSLKEGFTCPGPAIIEEVECTTLVRPAWNVTVDRYLNLGLMRA